MIDVNKNYWLYIHSHVYCNIKEKQALLYNTEKHTNMIVEDLRALSLLRSMHERGNLGAIGAEGKTIQESGLKAFVAEFCEKEMGGLLERDVYPEKPVQLMPVLNLQRDVEKLQQMGATDLPNKYLSYLLELNLFVCGECSQHCSLCNAYFQQNLCCKKNPSNQHPILDANLLQQIVGQMPFKNLGKLNLLGGDIFSYPYYDNLPELLDTFTGQVHVWNHYANYTKESTVFDFHYDIPVTFPIREEQWDICLQALQASKSRFHFYITDESEYEEAESVIARYKLKNYAIKPVYLKNKHAFFEKFIYIDHTDIFQEKPTFRELFAHQKLNTHFFGLLTIFPDGNVYANVNSHSLGNVFESSLIELIDKEMSVNTAWRKIRDSLPCSECLYQFICPSPSNYEMAINKPNLCHIKPG